jgi:two-component system CheB/CheR fusion protein
VTQLIWEFSIFHRLLRETLEELAANADPKEIFEAREFVMELADLSELSSVQQYMAETGQERDAAREQLRLANEQKDRFLAQLSHELRNPLAAVRTAVHILRGKASRVQKQRALEIVERQATYQARLVDDLLDVNRISLGVVELKKEPIDLRDTVDHAIDTFRDAIEDKGVNFRYERPSYQIMVLADPVRVEQAIANLLANAVKFTSAEGVIELSLSLEHQSAIVRVADTGVGIEPPMLSRLFNLFSQAESGRSEGGLGVGLWLAKHLVELHGGTIEASSEGVGKGSVFVVQMPVAAEIPCTSPRSEKRVLIVEDSPDQRELLLVALSELDVDFSAAGDGEQALAMASRDPFPVYIINVGLPDIDGCELARRLLEIHGQSRPVLVALTGYGSPEDLAKIKLAGFDYQLTKPADIRELQEIVLGQFRRPL